MELRHLRYFVRVAEERHFGRAAIDLGISQPPLSQQIRALEAELGVALFARTSRRVELTEAGKLFLPEARAVLEQAAHAVQVARRFQAGEVGELSIGFSSSAPFIPVIAGALARYRRAHPAIHLTFAEADRDAQLERLHDRRIDIGFIRGFDPPDLLAGMVATKVLDEPLVVAIREDHPLALEDRALTIADLIEVPIVLYDQVLGAGFNEQLAVLFRRRGHVLRIAQEVDGLASLLGAVAAGLGVSIVSHALSAIHADHMVHRPLDEPDAISRLWMVHRRQLSPAACRFVDILDAVRTIEAGAPA